MRFLHFLIILSLGLSTEGRQGRVIFLDTGSSIDLALQVIVPFGVALPLVKKESRQGRQFRIEDEIPEYAHPTYGPQLARLDSYFNYLEVEDEVCRRKLLCELAENPEEFYPIADLFLKQLESWSPEESEGRYAHYMMAAQDGFLSAINTSNANCEHIFGTCVLQARDIFDMDALNFWRFLSSILKFKISH